MSKERVAATADVPVGQVRVVQCGDRSLALSNLDGEFYAIDNVCTHDGGPLGEGRLNRGRVICPRHGAAFDAKTGRVLSLPAVRSVSSYRVIVEGDEVFVETEDTPYPSALPQGEGEGAEQSRNEPTSSPQPLPQEERGAEGQRA